MNLAVIQDNHWRKTLPAYIAQWTDIHIEQLDGLLWSDSRIYVYWRVVKGTAHDYTEKQIDGIKHLLQEGAGRRRRRACGRDMLSVYADESIIEKTVTSSPLSLTGSAVDPVPDTAFAEWFERKQFDTNILFSDFSFMAFPDIYTKSLKIRAGKPRSGPATEITDNLLWQGGSLWYIRRTWSGWK